jgi:hypothetical protein
LLAAQIQAMQRDLAAAHVAAIYNEAWQVRDLCRPHQRDKKAQAVARLGFAVRVAFNATENFVPLLDAIRDALTP